MVTFKEIISALAYNPELHAKFVNTLSLLEYIGARKIVKSQVESQISATVLAHMSEEIRHAQILKKIALKMSGGALVSYDDEFLLCGEEARSYIQGIDYGVAKELAQGQSPFENSWVNYLITTLLLEERANELYPYYETVLSNAGFPGIFKAIVREEESHLNDIRNLLQEKGYLTPERLAAMRRIEDVEFSKFLGSLSQKIFANPSNDANIVA